MGKRAGTDILPSSTGGHFLPLLCSVRLLLLSLRVIFSASPYSGERMSHFISHPSSNTFLKKKKATSEQVCKCSLEYLVHQKLVSIFCSSSTKGLSKLSEHRHVSQLAQAAITKCYRLGGSNNRHYFSQSWRLAGPKIRCQWI